MQYAWYEIVGMSILVGVVVFVVFRGLDLVLERLLDARRARQDKALAEVQTTGLRAAEGLRKMADEMRRLGRNDDRG